MTTGQPPATSEQQPSAPQDLEALLVVQAATLLAFEAGSAHTATLGLRRALARFTDTANRLWILAGASPAGTQVLGQVPREHVQQQLILELRQIATIVQQDLPAVLEREALAALEIGAKHAGEQTGLVLDPAEFVLDETARQIIDSTPAAAAENLLAAAQHIAGAQTGLDMQVAISKAQASVKSVNTGSTYLTNHVANDVPRQLAVRIGERLLWIAERDACVVCLALAGQLSDPNEGITFDEDATFGPYTPPSVWPYGMPLLRPPRHPHCRCQVCVWLGSAPGQPDLPSRLRHEAKRSILKGWSLPSESGRVRLRAAEKLLSSGRAGGLPKSVQEESRHAIAAGKFRSRTVPHPDHSRPRAPEPH
jgi:hypothetical protein